MTKRGVGAVALAVACVLTLWGLGLNAVRAQESAESPAWQPPRTPDGQPNIQGVWGSADTGMFSLQMEPVAHLRTLGMPQAGFIVSNQHDEFQMPSKSTIVVDPPTGVLPHQPWGARAPQQRDARVCEPGAVADGYADARLAEWHPADSRL